MQICYVIGEVMFVITTEKPVNIKEILVIADVVGLYPSIPNEAGLHALEEAL